MRGLGAEEQFRGSYKRQKVQRMALKLTPNLGKVFDEVDAVLASSRNSLGIRLLELLFDQTKHFICIFFGLLATKVEKVRRGALRERSGRLATQEFSQFISFLPH